MATVTVSTKDELESAVKNNAEKIIITGNLAKEIAKAQKKKSAAKKVGIGSAIGAGVAVAAGIAAAPFTGGVSAVAAATTASAVMTTAGGTAVALSTAELIALIAGALGALGIAAGTINSITKNYNVKVSAGSTTVECTRK